MEIVELLVFDVGDLRLATPLRDLARVAPRSAVGSDVDFGVRLGAAPATGGCQLTLATPPHATIRIDAVIQVSRVSAGHMQPLPRYVRERCRFPFVWGTADLDQESIMVVDLPRLCATAPATHHPAALPARGRR